jgi:hypothetical protein
VAASLARLVMLLLSVATVAAGAWAFWTQSGAYPLTHPALYACSLAPLAMAVVALVAIFVPFDNPASAPRWVAPLAGVAVGLTAAGLVMYTASFIWLAPGLLLYAGLLVLSARGVARSRPVEGAPPPPRVRMRDVMLVTAALGGVGLCWAWRAPAGGARPLLPGSVVAPILTSQAPHLRLVRVARKPTSVELSGNRIEVTLSLERPRLEVVLREQRIVIEPCLYVEEGTVDGFLSVPRLNGYRAEAAGPGEVELEEGPDVGFVRVTYPSARVGHIGTPGAWLGAWGRPPADALSARLDLAVDLKTGRVSIDALTTVTRPLTVRRSTLGWLQLPRAATGRLHVGLGSGLDVVPVEGRPGASTAPAELLVTDDGEVVRALRARRRDEGPFETVEVGPFDDWLAVEGLRDRFLVLAPDWQAQASLAPSRTAGHGLPENALMCWREGGALNVVFDVAGTRVGPGRLSTGLPAGLYRNRMVLLALSGSESAATRARVEQFRLELRGEAAPPAR